MGRADIMKHDLDPLLKTFNPEDSFDDRDVEDLIEEKLEEYRAPVVNFNELKAIEDESGLEQDFLEARRVLVDTIDRAKKIADLAFETMIIKNNDPGLLALAGESNKTVQASIKSLVELHMQTHKIVHQKLRNKREKELPDDSEDSVGDESKFASIGGIPTMVPKSTD